MKVKKLKEVWKDIPGYEGVYQVSNLGRVKSLSRKALIHGGLYRTVSERVLKQPDDFYGYPSVNLRKNQRGKTCLVHQLVLLAFVGLRPEGMDGCHNDGNPHNNKLSNLKYGTRAENELDKVLHGTDNRGERQGVSKLTEIQVMEIRSRYKAGNITQQILADEYGITRPNVSLIISGKRWGHVR